MPDMMTQTEMTFTEDKLRAELNRLEQVYAAFEAWYADVKDNSKKQAYVDGNWDSLVETALEHFDESWKYTEDEEKEEEDNN